MPIYVTRSSMPTIEDYIEEIRPIFESHMLTNMGPVYKRFQRQLINYLEVPELSLFVNGHMGLEIAINALGLSEKGKQLGGGEIITTPFTFVSTSHAIVRNGLKPVFCDIRKSDYCIDPEKIESLITEKTVGIIPVHVYGNICDVEAIDQIAKKHGLNVIYDAAHAFGVKYRGIGIGNFGDATMFSFHATKVFNSIEGGAIAFKNEMLRKPLHEMKNFGIHDEEHIDAIGGNAKLDEFRAAMGICNLKRINECIEARKSVYQKYVERLSGIYGIRLPVVQENVISNYAYFPVCFDASHGMNRDNIYQALKAQGIYARKYFYPVINDLECYRPYSDHATPIAHDVSMSILTLPIYEGLALDDVDRICDVILNR